jgi:hypothetical protein
MTENQLTEHEKIKFERITREERQKTQRAWLYVLQPWFDPIIRRGNDEGLRRRLTLIAVAKNNSDIFISRYDPALGERFEQMISGTFSEKIRLPILVFLFDESEHVPLRGIISKTGNQPEQLDWFT